MTIRTADKNLPKQFIEQHHGYLIMAKYSLLFVAGFFVFVVTASPTTHARGFGGMHGAMRGGGHIGGGIHRSAPRMNAPRMNIPRRGGSISGARPNMRNLGGARPGAQLGGGARRPGAASLGGRGGQSNLNRGGLGSALGSAGRSLGNGPLSGGGLSHLGFPGGSAHGFTGGGGGINPLRGVGGERNALGGERNSLGGERGAPGGERNRLGSAKGALGAAKAGERTGQSKLNSFLGLPSDGGMHSLAAHHSNAGGLGDHRGDGLNGRRPGLDGRRSGMDDRGHVRHDAGNLARHGDYVRRDFHGRGFYNADWYRRYPRCWHPRRWAYGTVWAAWDWAYLDGWFDYGDADPIDYDYGNTVVYQDNSVYVNGDDVGTADEYYGQASDLATTGADADVTSDDEQWLPLGVFAMTHDDQTKANLILQLAVNKQGIIRGNYTATLTDDTQAVQGSVDKKTQRAAWTIGQNKQNVFETGVDNLTKDEAPMLVHLGKDKTEQWTLVRLKDQGDDKGQGSGTNKSGDKDQSSSSTAP